MEFTSPVSPTQSNVQAALSNFIGSILPGIEVVAGLQNRVPEPKTRNFVVMTPIRFERIETNLVAYQDAKFIGSIAGTTLTVVQLETGGLGLGSYIFGTGVLLGTRITQLGPGPGLWLVTPGQTVPQATMGAGRKTWTQGAEVTIQLDFHSHDFDAGDMAQTFTTIFRDEFATTQFASQSPAYDVVPLHADDARRLPFINEAQQYEWRWVVEAHLQANDVVTLPMTFTDSLVVNVRSVLAEFPP